MDFLNLESFAGMSITGGHAFFFGKGAKTHSIYITGNRPKQYYIDSVEVSRDEAKKFVEKSLGREKLHPKEGKPFNFKESQMNVSKIMKEAIDEVMTPKMEAVEKIACLKCDEVSTKKAWEKNDGFCPKCKVSSQGVAE